MAAGDGKAIILIKRCSIGLALFFFLGYSSVPVIAQPLTSPAPVTGFIHNPKKSPEVRALDTVRAVQSALEGLRKVGGKSAILATTLSRLPAAAALEELAVRPPSGPSTTAVPKGAPDAPAAAVNYVGGGGGPIAGHPGVALILAQFDGESAFSAECTGTLVRPNVILTASHCICPPPPNSSYPDANTCQNGNQIVGPSALLDATRFRVFFQHEGLKQVQGVFVSDQYSFSSNGVHDDVALLVLRAPVAWITPVDVENTSDVGNTQDAISAGFGYTANPSAPSATALQVLTAPGLKSQGAIHLELCAGINYLNDQSALCSKFGTGLGGSAATICEGDSGGPMWIGSDTVIQIGVASGRTDENCTLSDTVGFEMRTAFETHRKWIHGKLVEVGMPIQTARWPPFGENLRNVLDRRNATAFDQTGNFPAAGQPPPSWIAAQEDGVVLATINAVDDIKSFALMDRKTGLKLCKGQAGLESGIPSVDYCFAPVIKGQQFRIVATGAPSAQLQFVVTSFPSGTKFDE
jgi:Trypsin